MTKGLSFMHQCADCGRFLTLAKPYGWYARGEFGEETGYICPRCLPTWRPLASNGSNDPRWCGKSDGRQ